MSSPRKGELVDDHVSSVQSKKAVTALMKHERAKAEKAAENELLPGKEQHVWLVLAVKKMQPLKKLKPHKIPLKHPLVDPRDTAVCLITKDPQREYKDLLEANKIKFISRVVGVQKLKGKFKGFDARRLLLRENGLFLADDRVIPLLPGLLGKIWFKAKKQPIPVSLTKKDLKTELENAISSTYMHQNQGTCTSIKIATLSHTDDQIMDNLKTAIPAAVARIHGGWDNVQSLHIKTSDSVSLPIWTCPLGAAQPGSRWAGMTMKVDGEEDEDWTGFGSDSEQKKSDGVSKSEAPPPAKTAQKSGAEKSTRVEKSKRLSVQPDAVEIENREGEQKKKRPSGDTTEEDQSAGKKKRKKRQSLEDTSERHTDTRNTKENEKDSAKTVSFASAPTPSSGDATRGKKKQPAIEASISNDTLVKKELKQKKVTLENTKLAKKKEKLKETVKSSRKGVKAKLIGKVKSS